MIAVVEVLGRCSKLEPIKIPTEVEAYRSPRPKTAPPRIHSLDKRLDPAIVAELVAAYECGTPTTQLTARYNLGKRSVLKILHEAGADIRRQGMTPAEIAEAVRRYEAGESLARIGDRLGRHPSVIRRALARVGMQIRTQ